MVDAVGDKKKKQCTVNLEEKGTCLRGVYSVLDGVESVQTCCSGLGVKVSAAGQTVMCANPLSLN